MANRSDFNEAKLPRYLKRALSLQCGYDESYFNSTKKIFIGAHAIHKAYKQKKRNSEDNVDTSEKVV